MRIVAEHEAFALLLEHQNGICAICSTVSRRPLVPYVQDLVLDHDHVTGIVRGLLCQRHNPHEHLPGWDEYRANTPAAQLGIVATYFTAFGAAQPDETIAENCGRRLTASEVARAYVHWSETGEQAQPEHYRKVAA